MKTGRTLQELAAELTRQQESKRDYLADIGFIEARRERRDLTDAELGELEALYAELDAARSLEG